MRKLFLISSLLAVSSSRYIFYGSDEGGALFHRFFKSERRFTESELSAYLKVMRKYPGYVPQEIQRVFQKLSSKTVRDLTIFINEIRGDYIELPSSPIEVIRSVQRRLPELETNLNEALNMLVSTIERLTPSSRETFQKYWTIFFETVSAPAPLRTMFLAALFEEIYGAFERADDSALREIHDVSQESFRLLRSDFVKEFCYAASKFATHNLKKKTSTEERDGF